MVTTTLKQFRLHSEAIHQSWLATHPGQSVACGVARFSGVFRAEIGQLILLAVAPDLFRRIEFGRIDRQKLQLNGSTLRGRKLPHQTVVHTVGPFQSLFGRILWCLFILVLPKLSFAAPKGVIVRGLYEYRGYLGRPTPRLLARLEFTVALGRCSWLIDYRKLYPIRKADDDIQTIAGCDGTNIYTIHLPSGLAQVCAGTYPYSREIHLEYLWLAFAARCVLVGSGGTAKPPLPIDIGIFNRSDYRCQYRWTIRPNGIPLRLDFSSDGTYFSRDPITGQVQHGRFPPPYATGFTLATGHWISATNVAGTAIPLDFDFTGFLPKPRSPSLQKTFGFRCIVTNVSIGYMPPLPPGLPQKALVTDRRFANLGYAYVNYWVTNGIWPSTANGSVRRLLAHAPRFSVEDEALAELGIRQIGNKVMPEQKHSRRNFARWILLLVVACPALFFCVRPMLKRKYKQSEQH